MTQMTLAPVTDQDFVFAEQLGAFVARSHGPWPDALGDALRAYSDAVGDPSVRALSLFSGAGGLDIGFHDAGVDVGEAVEVEPRFTQIVESAWNKLPSAGAGCEPDAEELYWFTPPDGPDDFVEKRQQATRRVIDAIDSIERNDPIGPWRVCHRYSEGLPQQELSKLRILSRKLEPHAGPQRG